MKTVTMTLKGNGKNFLVSKILDRERLDKESKEKSFFELESEEILDMDTTTQILVILDELEVLCNDDIIIKKGKYINRKDYFSKIIEKDSYVIGNEDIYIENIYEIELEDNEEFDPLKLQLIKSDYELDFLPYGIITDYIVYDGKIINNYDNDYPFPEDYWVNIIDYNLPYK